MAASELTGNLSVLVKVTNSVAEALRYRFAQFDSAATEPRGVKTHVPGATGAVAQGILAQSADTKIVNGYVTSSIIKPDGSVALVELGEAVAAINAPLRVGGNGAEVDGAAYLANATGDVIVGYALALGNVGDIIPIQFLGYAGVAP